MPFPLPNHHIYIYISQTSTLYNPHISTLPPPARTTNSPSGSWVERVRVTDTTTRFSLDSIPRQACGTRLRISEELLSESSDKGNSCMIGFFPGFKMTYHTIK
jgi:hypothetical protein